MLQDLFSWLNALAAPYELRFTVPEALYGIWLAPVFVLTALLSPHGRWFVRMWQSVVRCVWLAALVLAAAWPVHDKYQEALSLVTVLDVSRSMEASFLTKADVVLAQLKQRVGETPHTTLYVAESPSTSRDGVGRREVSNLASGISAASAFFEKESTRRVLLLSDGKSTQGDVVAAAEKLGAEKIPVYVLSLGEEVLPTARMRGVSLPDRVRAKEDFSAEISLEARQEMSATLSVYARAVGSKGSGALVAKKTLQLVVGENRSTVPITLSSAGRYELRAVLAPEADLVLGDNEASGFVEVEELPKVLLLHAPGKVNPALDTALSGVAERFTIDSAEALPKTLVALGKYDLVLLNNLETTKFSDDFGDLLTRYVTELGGGLVLSCGDASKDLAEPPEDTPIEELLPLSFERIKQKEEVPLAVVFVVDKSASMDRARKFEMAISAVKQAAKNLKDDAEVSVVLFDDLPYLALPIVKAKEREKIETSLSALSVGGGTDLYPAIKSAYGELKKSEAKIKHIIVLSDGESLSRYEQNSDIVDKITREKITVSTVGLSADSDPLHLDLLAKKGGGTFYYTEDPSKLPDIFAKETQTTTETTVKQAPVKVSAQAPADLLEGIDIGAAPALRAFLSSQPKPTSEVILVAGSKKEPILARWYRGLGRVAVFTGDAGQDWAASWKSWDSYARFWEQLVRSSLRGRVPSTLKVKRRVSPEGEAVIEVEALGKGGLPDEAAKIVVCLRASDSKEQCMQPEKVGRAVYRATTMLPTVGSYEVEVMREGGEAEPSMVVSDVTRLPAGDESVLGEERLVLQEIARKSGGEVFTDPALLLERFLAKGETTRHEQEDRWAWFVWCALGVFLLDVLSRRLA